MIKIIALALLGLVMAYLAFRKTAKSADSRSWIILGRASNWLCLVSGKESGC
ncbi:MAG: hypothetical protein OEY36_03825 [Gammaproteobacteria bacterium]|nr:hypothetical protein [Gammaproteobacteria bacterium]